MDQLKEQIIKIAKNMFQLNGIRNVSIDEICNELHISKKTFYTHFGQKEDLVDAILTLEKEIQYNKFVKNLSNKNAIEALVFILKEMKKNADCQPHNFWYDIAKYYPKVFERHDQQRIEEMKIGFEANLKQGIDEGFYRKDLDIELTSLFHTIQVKKTYEIMEQMPIKYTKKRMMDFFIDLMIHLIATEKGLQYFEENYVNDTKNN